MILETIYMFRKVKALLNKMDGLGEGGDPGCFHVLDGGARMLINKVGRVGCREDGRFHLQQAHLSRSQKKGHQMSILRCVFAGRYHQVV